MTDSRYRSRKFLAWAVVLALATILLWFGKLQPQNWENVVTWATIGYAFSNALQAVGLGARAVPFGGQHAAIPHEGKIP